MDCSDTVALASALIHFRSLSGAEGPITDFLFETLSARSWDVERLPIGDGRDNLFVSFGTPEIVFTTHTDVVPGPDDAFSPAVRDGRLYGRGACDTKGIIATMVTVAERLRARSVGNFGLLFVVGEEVDGIGARRASQQLQGRGIRFIINGEPTEGKIMRAHKGCLGLEISCTGVACHSGYPDEGKDANAELVRILARIIDHPWPVDATLGSTTVNCGIIQGGMAGNIVSPSADARVVFRTVASNAEILSTVKQLLSPSASMQLGYDVPLVSLLEIPGMPSDVAAYSTDIPNFASLGAECVLYGPGSILVAHTDEEYIALKDIEEAILGYEYIFDHLKERALW
jgi:acetylornithine deacetylase